MTASLPKLRSAREFGRRERKEARRKLRATVAVGPRGKGATQVELADISTQGCNLLLGENDLRPGQIVAIRWDRAKSFMAIIRWVRSGRAGVEFAQPIPSALADEIAELE